MGAENRQKVPVKKKVKSTHINIIKKKMLKALEKSMGVVSYAAKTAKINRVTHYNWMKNDPEYATAVQDLENVTLDFAESQLHKSIKKGNVVANIFYLKCRGKQRGYIDHISVDGKLMGDFTINVKLPEALSSDK